MTVEQSELDPLLECLVIFTRLYNRPYSAQSLVADFPIEPGRKTPLLFSLDGKPSKSVFSRAAKRAGFASKIVTYSLSEFSRLLLPVILVLEGDKACILTEFSDDGSHAKVIVPELGDGEHWLPLADLESEYSGVAFLMKPEHHYRDARKKVLKHEQGHWFWSTLKFSRSIYSDVLVASFLLNIFLLATPLFTMNVYDRVVPNGAVDTLWVLATGILVVYVFDVVLKLLRTYFLENAAKKSDVIMSSLVFEKVMNLKMSAKPNSVGSFASSIKEFDSIRSFFTSSTISAFIDLPFMLIFFLVIYLIGGWMVAIPVISGLLIIALSFLLEKPLRESVVSTYEASAHKNAVLVEALSGMETIKALGFAGQIQWKWEEATGDIASKGLRSRILTGSISSVVNFVVQLNTVAILIGGVYAISESLLSMGGLIAVMMLGSRSLSPLAQVASLIANFQQTKTAYDTVNEIMQRPVEREEGHKFVERSEFKGKIEFKNVTFAYPGSERAILNNASFVINAGESVGIIGTNGCGKTTIEKLIMGLYEPTEGAILIDGIDSKQIDPSDLRRNISYVPQDIVLFQGTVKDNIIARLPNASDEQIIKAAQLSGVDLFLNSHPMGFDMPVGERGEGLSGGQRQAIGVARSFIHDSPILLMDEPSNAMDSNAEMRLAHSIQQHKVGRTLIMVSHKNTMLELTDRLILLKDGQVVMDGTNQDVIRQLSGAKRA